MVVHSLQMESRKRLACDVLDSSTTHSGLVYDVTHRLLGTKWQHSGRVIATFKRRSLRGPEIEWTTAGFCCYCCFLFLFLFSSFIPPWLLLHSYRQGSLYFFTSVPPSREYEFLRKCSRPFDYTVGTFLRNTVAAKVDDKQLSWTEFCSRWYLRARRSPQALNPSSPPVR